MRKLLLTLTLSLSLIFTVNMSAEASSSVHNIKSGDTLWNIAQHYGVSVNQIKDANGLRGYTIFIGNTLTIPNPISSQERHLMEQLVTAEAKGEPYAGQVAVATVILNRVDSELFPNTINGVIHDPGQFTPVHTGTINQTPTESAKKAVAEAIAFRGQGNGSLFFYNPTTATNHWNATRQHTITIGNHVFAK
ncbi:MULTISPECIES: cell wall hydrolase [Bacillaceae]|uniref:Cell wall hydrolase n=1 Tax=Evansella alkalicola TaxID=745819 RepID=A0ABS6JTY5_9BACI|nr:MULTISPECIES: cell wall hydrolase [Bacillaceae]MBU9722049.1 cell wall hydrolase [Bacillus alkalicola]